MHSSRSSHTLFLAIGLLSSALLPSCSLPPGYAWRQIQRDGLIPFIQNGMSAPKAQPGAMMATNGTVAPTRSYAATTTAAPLRSGPFPPAYPVTGLTGYVRTPFTNPPRLVDVRNMTAGTTVRCPYTQNQFIVPTAAVQPAPMVLTSPQMMAQTQPGIKAKPKVTPVVTPKPAPTPVMALTEPKPAPPKPNPAPAPAPTPAASAVASTPKPAPVSAPTPAPTPALKTKPVETPKVAASTPPPSKPEPKTAPAPAPAKTQSAPPPVAAAAPAKLPFGSAITGRPGFVNSPYAEKHQLVDVTGLSVGTEVKCPYTGKLFRVPPQQQARN